MTSEEAFAQWLEEWVSPDHLSPSELAAKAWQAALEWAATEQEPIAWMLWGGSKTTRIILHYPSNEQKQSFSMVTPLYTHPALTLEEELAECKKYWGETHAKLTECQARETALRDALNAVQEVAKSTTGIIGWHLNGDIATWNSVLPEVNIVCALPSDDTALKEALKAAKREAFLEAAQYIAEQSLPDLYSESCLEDFAKELQRMAEELK